MSNKRRAFELESAWRDILYDDEVINNIENYYFLTFYYYLLHVHKFSEEEADIVWSHPELASVELQNIREDYFSISIDFLEANIIHLDPLKRIAALEVIADLKKDFAKNLQIRRYQLFENPYEAVLREIVTSKFLPFETTYVKPLGIHVTKTLITFSWEASPNNSHQHFMLSTEIELCLVLQYYVQNDQIVFKKAAVTYLHDEMEDRDEPPTQIMIALEELPQAYIHTILQEIQIELP